MSVLHNRFVRTKKERKYRRFYYSQTGFEFADDTTRPFIEVVAEQVKWYQDHTADVYLRISGDALWKARAK